MSSRGTAGSEPGVQGILFVGAADWANLSNRIVRGINDAAGRRLARVWTLHAHPFRYPEDLVGPESAAAAAEHAARCDWIVTTGDGDYTALTAMLSHLELRGDVLLAATHAGSAYRRNSKMYDRFDGQILRVARRFVGADSLRLATQSPPTLPYWSTTDGLRRERREGTARPRVGHSPTDRRKKGTGEILTVLRRLADQGRIELELIENVSYTQATSRRGTCDIFVDQMDAGIGGFGASAVEAMGQGCAVLADVRHSHGSDAQAGWDRLGVTPPPIVHVGTRTELSDELDRLLSAPRRLEAVQTQAEAWAEQSAKPSSVGQLWLGLLSEAAEELRGGHC